MAKQECNYRSNGVQRRRNEIASDHLFASGAFFRSSCELFICSSLDEKKFEAFFDLLRSFCRS